MKKSEKKNEKKNEASFEIRDLLLIAWGAVMMLVPLAFSTSMHRALVLPKFVILLIGSSVVLLLFAMTARGSLGFLRSRHFLIVSLFMVAVTISTLFAASPVSALFGSYFNQMGLLTRLCFFICFMALVVAVGRSYARLTKALWVMELTGLIVAVYAVAQFFGKDPFLPSSAYTVNSPDGPVLRVISTLGHANYLGNFLLYTAPLGLGLALSTSGRSRRIALISVALSTAAIAMSGTRGAWLGLAAGAAVFAFLELRAAREKKRLMMALAAAAIIAVVSIATILVVPASRSISLRARSFFTEGFTGAGRTVLWRDAARMVPRYALAGCGPEGFSRAFLAYKSKELARLAQQINNESSHNSYLDAAINYGLAGAALYLAMIASALHLLVVARRRTSDPRARMMIAGLVSSLAAVAAHNFFIFDQMPTGLYFFSMMAIAPAVSNVTGRSEPEKKTDAGWSKWAAASVCAALLAAAVWYGVRLAQADMSLKRAYAAAQSKDFDALVASSEQAGRSPDPTGSYDFLAARALALYADAPLPKTDESRAARQRAIEVAASHVEKSLSRSLTPEADYLLLAHLARERGDLLRQKEYTGKAIALDANYSRSRAMMAEAYLVEGDRQQAEREAQAALDISPRWSRARKLLKRARGSARVSREKIAQMIDDGLRLAEAGRTWTARKRLIRAITSAAGECAECHRALALVYERDGLYENAIAQWELFMRQDPAAARLEQTEQRIASLRRNLEGR